MRLYVSHSWRISSCVEAVHQLAQPGLWHLLQHLPEDVVTDPAHIEGHPLVQLARLLYDERVRCANFW